MFKSKNSAMFVVAALCGYLALMTPDWKTELQARSSAYSSGLDSADQAGELFFYDPAGGQTQVWQLVNNDQDSIVYTPNQNTAWSAYGIGDFNADGTDDIFWFKTSTGQQATWLMSGGNRSSVEFMKAFGAAGYTYKGIGDFDGDGDDDIFYKNESTGQTRIWQIDHTTVDRLQQDYTNATNQAFSGIGDISGDGIDDIFWRKAGGQLQVWLMAANAQDSVVYGYTYNEDFEIAAVGDFDADGLIDVYFRNYTTGQNTVWLMDSTATKGRKGVQYLPGMSTTNGFDIVGVVDADGDGDDDVLWRNPTSGQQRISEMQGGNVVNDLFITGAATKFVNIMEQ